ncbi:hypothetical protein UF70_1993 [Staphylococcus pasteuri]|nr:hypothetical protein UF70_1993 [Staphylococcus pasteuri]
MCPFILCHPFLSIYNCNFMYSSISIKSLNVLLIYIHFYE